MPGKNEYSELINEIRGLRKDINKVIGETQDKTSGKGRTFNNNNDYHFDNPFLNAVLNSSQTGREKRKTLLEHKASLETLKESQEEKLKTYYDKIANHKKLTPKELAEFKELSAEHERTNKNLKETDTALDNVFDTTRVGGFINKVKGVNEGFKTLSTSLTDMWRTASNFAQPWAKADNAASKYAKTIGATKAGMDALRDSTIRNVVQSEIGINFNVSTEELIQAQQNYIEGIGRSLKIDSKAQESLAAMHAVMGGKENDLAIAFENFGVGLEKTGEHAGKMFDEAAKKGISFSKYTDAVAKNIKIAQNYTFKNGLKGLESMAQKAVALKMDMGQVASFAEKISTVEGSIDVASKLQVLGGPFARMADPLGMMSEGLLDMESLMDRVTNMIGDLGTFDRTTGEVRISAFNKQRIKAMAQATGMDYSQLMESATHQTKRKEIESEINKSATARGLSDEMKELIKNAGTFNKEGQAGVSINGQFKTIDQLTQNDYKTLVKETQSESDDIKDIARTLRGWDDVMQGTAKQKEAVQAELTGPVAQGMKNIADKIGHSNLLLTALVIAQGIGAATDIFSKGLDIFRMFRGRGGGLFRSGSKVGRVGNGILRGLGKTKVGRGFRIARVGWRRGFGHTVGTVGNNIGRIGSRGLMGFGMEKLGQGAYIANQRLGNFALNMSGRSGLTGRIGTKLFEQTVKNEAQMFSQAGIKAGAKQIGKAGAKRIGAGLIKGAAKGGGLGMVLGIAGEGVDMWKDSLVAKGKIKEGGTTHTAMNVGAKALKGAGIGAAIGSFIPGIGTAIGAAVGAIGGAIVGGIQSWKLKKKIKAQKGLDNKLKAMGLERQGDYDGGELNNIRKAIDTGKISDKMRRKLEEKGDIAILNKIDEVKQQKDAEAEDKKDRAAERLGKTFGGMFGGVAKNVAKANIKVNHAYFNGIAFGGNGVNVTKKNVLTSALSSMLFPIPGITKAMIALANKDKANENGVTITGTQALTGESIEGKELNKQEGANVSKYDAERVKYLEEKIATLEKQTKDQGVSGKFDLNINGTIKLVGANGQGIDITNELKNNDQFQKELAKLISEQMQELYGGVKVPYTPSMMNR